MGAGTCRVRVAVTTQMMGTCARWVRSTMLRQGVANFRAGGGVAREFEREERNHLRSGRAMTCAPRTRRTCQLYFCPEPTLLKLRDAGKGARQRRLLFAFVLLLSLPRLDSGGRLIA
jgi:hypothetical protein